MIVGIMFATTLIRRATSPTFQQFRYSRKTFRFHLDYGIPPLVTQDDYMKAVAEDRLENLEYTKIRFAKICQNSSPLHDDKLETFIKFLLRKGQKDKVYEVMHKTFYQLKSISFKQLRNQRANGNDPQDPEKEPIETNPMSLFKKALENCEPLVITKKVKRGGAVYQVPYPLSKDQSEYYSIKWLIKAVKDRPKPRKKHFPEVMAQEVMEAVNGRGKVVKMRDDIHRLADANKAYSHYRWG